VEWERKLSYKLDYQEPARKVLERLEDEHAEFRAKLARIIGETESDNLGVATSLLVLFKPLILRHAVEEEARIMRVIAAHRDSDANGRMHDEAKKEGEVRKSIEVMREHRRITEFFAEKLPHLDELPHSRQKSEIEEFVRELARHHEEEEAIAFPLFLRLVSRSLQ
jgi:hemerythrin